MPKRNAKKSNNFAKKVKNVLYAVSETKHNNLSLDTVSIQDVGRTPLNYTLNDVALGNQQSQRDGNQILVTGIYGKGVIQFPDTYNIVRMILYIPKDSDHKLGTDDTIDVPTLLDQDRYTILEDRYFAGAYDGGPRVKTFTIKKSFTRGGRKGMVTRWDGVNATDFSRNPIGLYFVSDSVAVSDPTVTLQLRTYYKDL